MAKSKDVERFEKDLKENKELQKKFEEAVESYVAKDVKNVDAMIKAAEEMGYVLTIADLEKIKAEAEELSKDDLETVAGAGKDWCWFIEYCAVVTRTDWCNGGTFT